MTLTETYQSVAPASTPTFQRWVETLRAALRRRQDYLHTVAELSRLTDRELADLGFFRSDIPRIARESVKGGL